jgi:hypothetical protein
VKELIMAAARIPKVVWMKKKWKLKENPFPSEAIARLGGEDPRENGQLFDPDVQPEKLAEAAEKFVLGAAYGGQKFGYLWSLGTGLHGDARGFGKSVILQWLVEQVNEDFGKRIFLEFGLEESDAEEHPLCAVLASFDMANARSLNAVFYEAARYACRFSLQTDPPTPTLAERIRARLAAKIGDGSPAALRAAIERVQENQRGRTLGPLVAEFVEFLCAEDHADLRKYVDEVTPAKRSRSGASFLATFLVMVKAAGINHVLLCCDQLEDFAAPTTTRQRRSIEVERFRDYILELQPMSDMLSCVVTMHPRATQAIGDMWRLADLPSYDHDREENRQRVVILERITSVDKARRLMQAYLARFRSGDGTDPIAPFTLDAIEAILERSDGKPRDILRKANALIDAGSDANWDVIDASRAGQVLDSFTQEDDDYATAAPSPRGRTTRDPWSEG